MNLESFPRPQENQEYKNPEGKKKKGFLDNNPTIKKALIGLSVIGALGGTAKAGTTQEKAPLEGKEISVDPSRTDTRLDNTLKIKNFESRVFDNSNFFVVDKYDISPENITLLENQFEDFILQYINPQTINQLLASHIEVASSCDQRPTNAYIGGNAELATNRGNTTKEVLERVLKQIDLSESGLSQDQINALRNLHVTVKIANEGQKQYPQIEAGVTPLTHNDGSLYSEEEIADMKKNNPEQLEALYQLARYNRVSLKVDNIKLFNEEVPVSGNVMSIGKYTYNKDQLTAMQQKEHKHESAPGGSEGGQFIKQFSNVYYEIRNDKNEIFVLSEEDFNKFKKTSKYITYKEKEVEKKHSKYREEIADKNTLERNN